MSTNSMGVLLDPEDVAAELGTDTTHVYRLIGRGELPATKLVQPGGSTARRITRNAVATYVANGAPDWDAPAFNARYFAENLSAPVERFRQALMVAAEPQELKQQEVNKHRAKDSRATSIDVVIKISPAILTAALEPDPFNKLKPVTSKPSRYSNMAELWLVDGLRTQAEIFIQSAGASLLPLLLRLYDTPERYTEIVNAALANFRKLNIVWHADWMVPGDPKASPADAAHDDRKMTVFYLLNHGTLIDGVGGLVKPAIAKAF